MSENFSENVKEIIDNNPSYNKTEFGGVYDHLPYHRRVIQLSIDDFKQSKYFKSLKVNIDERDEVDMEKKFIEELLQNDCDVNKLKYSDEKEVVNEVEDEVENEEVNEEVSEEVTV